MLQKILFIFTVALMLPPIAFAHPGNTASDGCHYCRTNCDKWGEVWGERHCHGGYAAPVRTNTPTTPSCPSNAYYSGGSCVCKVGYNAFQGSCVKVPANAHVIDSSTDAWACNTGYEEKSGACKRIVVPEIKEEKTEPQVIDEEDIADTKESDSGVSDEQLKTIKNYIEELEAENTDSSFGSFLSMAAISIGGFMAYKKFKK